MSAHPSLQIVVHVQLGAKHLVRAYAGLFGSNGLPMDCAPVYGGLLPCRQLGAERKVRSCSPQRHARTVANPGRLEGGRRVLLQLGFLDMYMELRKRDADLTSWELTDSILITMTKLSSVPTNGALLHS